MACLDADTLVTLSSALGTGWEAKARHALDCPTCGAALSALTGTAEALRARDITDDEIAKIERGIGYARRKEEKRAVRSRVPEVIALFGTSSTTTFFALMLLSMAPTGGRLPEELALLIAVVTGTVVTARTWLAQRARTIGTAVS